MTIGGRRRPSDDRAYESRATGRRARVSVRDARAQAVRRLAAGGIESPDVDADHLLANVLGTSRAGLALRLDDELDDAEAAELERLVTRRASREPLAYVLGEWGFRGLTLKTDRRALVPRPETEIVVERCLELLAAHETPRVLDVGTGTGAIALAIAGEHSGARVTALDNSLDALVLARENAERAELAGRVALLLWDATEALPAGPFDLVVSNPPYVTPGELGELAPEVRDWEPREALVDAGQAAAICEAARASLAPGGHLVLEVAWRDGEAGRVAARLEELGYREIRVVPDLAGRERVVSARFGPNRTGKTPV